MLFRSGFAVVNRHEASLFLKIPNKIFSLASNRVQISVSHLCSSRGSPKSIRAKARSEPGQAGLR